MGRRGGLWSNKGGEIVAEFQEVMRQLNRLCSHFQNCNENGCPMFDECGNIGAHCSGPKHSYRIEKTVMAWAAEHPEPVYPTWADYISRLVVKDICTGKISGPETVLTYAMNTPVPADIAQKLGIEPKEGT